MSDIRTRILLGTSISAITIMFVMAAGLSTVTSEASVNDKSFGLNGHVTIMAVNPELGRSAVQAFA